MADTSTKRQAISLAGAAALALAAVGLNEGAFSNDPKDPGGATNHGVTETVARQAGYTGDMRALTQAQANTILWQNYAVGPGISPVVQRSVAAGLETFDSSVNLGPARPSAWLQTALNSLNNGGTLYPDLVVDGKLGPKTYAALDALIKWRGNAEACRVLVKLMDAQQGAEYLRLTQQTNHDLERFMWGWARTRLGNVPLAQCDDGGTTG